MAQIFGMDYSRLNEEIQKKRNEGKRIAMCSGTFDLSHPGHTRFLKSASTYGDVLIVVVKSDNAASKKKKDAPVLDQNERMEVISGSAFVDYVVLADYDENRIIPYTFSNIQSVQWFNIMYPVVDVIKPDVFIHEDNPQLAEARRQLFNKYNIEGIVHQRTEGISTTIIINRIKKRFINELLSKIDF